MNTVGSQQFATGVPLRNNSISCEANEPKNFPSGRSATADSSITAGTSNVTANESARTHTFNSRDQLLKKSLFKTTSYTSERTTTSYGAKSDFNVIESPVTIHNSSHENRNHGQHSPLPTIVSNTTSQLGRGNSPLISLKTFLKKSGNETANNNFRTNSNSGKENRAHLERSKSEQTTNSHSLTVASHQPGLNSTLDEHNSSRALEKSIKKSIDKSNKSSDVYAIGDSSSVTHHSSIPCVSRDQSGGKTLAGLTTTIGRNLWSNVSNTSRNQKISGPQNTYQINPITGHPETGQFQITEENYKKISYLRFLRCCRTTSQQKTNYVKKPYFRSGQTGQTGSVVIGSSNYPAGSLVSSGSDNNKLDQNNFLNQTTSFEVKNHVPKNTGQQHHPVNVTISAGGAVQQILPNKELNELNDFQKLGTYGKFEIDPAIGTNLEQKGRKKLKQLAEKEQLARLHSTPCEIGQTLTQTYKKQPTINRTVSYSMGQDNLGQTISNMQTARTLTTRVSHSGQIEKDKRSQSHTTAPEISRVDTIDSIDHLGGTGLINKHQTISNQSENDMKKSGKHVNRCNLPNHSPAMSSLREGMSRSPRGQVRSGIIGSHLTNSNNVSRQTLTELTENRSALTFENKNCSQLLTKVTSMDTGITGFRSHRPGSFSTRPESFMTLGSPEANRLNRQIFQDMIYEDDKNNTNEYPIHNLPTGRNSFSPIENSSVSANLRQNSSNNRDQANHNSGFYSKPGKTSHPMSRSTKTLQQIQKVPNHGPFLKKMTRNFSNSGSPLNVSQNQLQNFGSTISGLISSRDYCNQSINSKTSRFNDTLRSDSNNNLSIGRCRHSLI